MTVIDQRILIAAPSEAVWVYLSDPSLVSRWNRLARQVSTLTTKLTGVGTRRRCTDANGRSVVEEMTAWLDNIGYEYKVIDGPYKDFKGRIRLQPVPEGTVVNWTIEYQLRGALGGLRDLFGWRRGMQSQMTDSLRALNKLIQTSGIRLDPERQKRVAMQADPGLAVRTARQGEPPRTAPAGSPPTSTPAAGMVMPTFAKQYVDEGDMPELPDVPPTTVPTSVPTSVPTLAPQPLQTMPPLQPPIIATRAAPPPAAPPPAAFIVPLAAAAASDDDTKPRPPKGLREALEAINNPPAPPGATPTIASAGMGDLDETVNPLASSSPTVPIDLVAPKRPPDPPTVTMTGLDTVAPDKAPVPASATEEPTPPSNPELMLPPPSKLDTGEMSIWDIFGMEKPSDRQKAEVDELIASLKSEPPRPASSMKAQAGNVAKRKLTTRPKTFVKVRRKDAKTHAKAAVKIRHYR